MGGMSDEKKVLVAACVCGGWVMVASLGHSNACDADSFKEAGKLAARGFAVETMPLAQYREMDNCKHRGACTTNPKAVPDANQLGMFAEATQ